MKAVKYSGPYQVTVADVPEPKIQAPGDAIVRITTQAGRRVHQGAAAPLSPAAGRVTPRQPPPAAAHRALAGPAGRYSLRSSGPQP